MVDRRTHLVGQQIELQLTALHIAEREGRLTLGAAEGRVDLHVVELLERLGVSDDAIARVVARASRELAEDVVTELRHPQRTFEHDSLDIEAQRAFERVRALYPERRISRLECGGSVMRTAREKLRLRRCARGARENPRVSREKPHHCGERQQLKASTERVKEGTLII